ncbi:DUF1661 domain-containing protein [Porphyromonas gulae]|uniref:DUF1661 domain-containing protein n=1 Tax=Porphyromonas gulae TaxID=111105 RepID=UPI0026F2FC5D|nr:DUF1661 domain-containing protein [Porphyromonas gulae]
MAREAKNSRAKTKNFSRQKEKILARPFRKNTRHLYLYGKEPQLESNFISKWLRKTKDRTSL